MNRTGGINSAGAGNTNSAHNSRNGRSRGWDRNRRRHLLALYDVRRNNLRPFDQAQGRLARLHPLPRGNPGRQHQPQCQQRLGHGEPALTMRHGAHHGTLKRGMRTALLELVKHLIDDAHCNSIHATPSKTTAATPATTAHGSQSRRASGVSAAASPTCLANTCCLPSLNASIRALCAIMLINLGVPPVTRYNLFTAPLLNSVSPGNLATARRWRR